MSLEAIRVEKLGKRYLLGDYLQERQSFLSQLSQTTRNLGSLLRGQGWPAENLFWALQDVSFVIRPGETVGVLGANGSGKSTLLKILSRVTQPTSGRALVWGRVGSLLEVGTGFHRDLTGRENIYLSGALLGLKADQIAQEFDEIVAFAGVERFLETPVKHYSSGMRVRLGFSVAVHLQPEVLLIDEVLSVGDWTFQQKCNQKIREIAGGGRTILLVSHSTASLERLCSRTLVLESGQLVFDGSTRDGISEYLRKRQSELTQADYGEAWKVERTIHRPGQEPTIKFLGLQVHDRSGQVREQFRSDEEVCFSVYYECLQVVENLRLVVFLKEADLYPVVLSTENLDAGEADFHCRREPGTYRSMVVVPANLFGDRDFGVEVRLSQLFVEDLIARGEARCRIVFRGYGDIAYNRASILRPCLDWHTQAITVGEVPKRDGPASESECLPKDSDPKDAQGADSYC